MEYKTLIAMSSQEMDRVAIIGKVANKELKQAKAAKRTYGRPVSLYSDRYGVYGAIYQIQTETKGYRMRHAQVTVCERQGVVEKIILKGHYLNFKRFERTKKQTTVLSGKEVNRLVDKLAKSDGHRKLP